MNGTYDIYAILRRGMLLLLACGSLAACVKDEEFDATMPDDRNTLLASGRYLTARNTTPKIGEGDAARWFDVGTRYRLLAYVKAYMGSLDGTGDESLIKDNTPAEVLRFDLEAWEDEVTTGGLRFIHIDCDPNSPDQLFGFQAMPREPNYGTQGLVSLDFYGFTYGNAEVPAELTGGTMARNKLYRHEEVDATTGELKDLMWGKLLNQNIVTAGNRDYVTNADNLPPAEAAQSVLPFTHSFARLDIQVAQEGKEETETGEDGKPVTETKPFYPNLYVDGIRITNTYSQGNVYMHNGLVELLGSRGIRPLTLRDAYGNAVDNIEVMPVATEVGRMMIFPSDGNSLINASQEIADGYDVGMEIDVRCDNRTTMTQYLVNTKTAEDKAAAEKLITTSKDAGGKEWYAATVKKSAIIDSYDTGTGTGSEKTFRSLRFMQNTIYQLQVIFSEHTVRIITVIPLVMDWLPGEGDSEDPWQDMPMGQPQMFDNVVWSDRNLGADHFDPKGANFENTIGYFYQVGRNIPYYPFDTRQYYKDYKPDDPEWFDREIANYYDDEAKYKNNATEWDRIKAEYRDRWSKVKMERTPTLADKHTVILANVQDYNHTTYRFYPMVDPSLIYMMNHKSGFGLPGGNKGYDAIFDWTWAIGDGEPTTIDIPESKPAEGYFDFKKLELHDYDNMHWENGQRNQPVKGSWVVPTSQQYLTIFPSTPHAGNLAFRKGGDNTKPMEGWGGSGYGSGMDASSVTTLRVTVPYYTQGMAEPTGRSENYLNAWRTLQENNDAGTTHIQSGDDAYTYITIDDKGNTTSSNWGPSNSININSEPDGDPEDGYASTYIISREGDDKTTLGDTGNYYAIQSWGTIYAIKRAYTSEAYRMRWRVLIAGYFGKNKAPGLYVEVCRYRCDEDDMLTEDNFKTKYDWDHPVATIYFPITGLGDFTAVYINFGTECMYATSDPITYNGYGGRTSAVQIKVTGNEESNVYMAVVKGCIPASFGMQIRPVGGGSVSK